MHVSARLRHCSAGAALLLSFLFCTLPLAAQSTATVYSGKFACGTVSGNLPNATDSTPPAALTIYRDVEPGSYATALNILHTPYTPPNQAQLVDLRISIVVDGLGQTTFNSGLLPFTAKKMGCPEITQKLAQAFPAFVADGHFVEGYLHVRAFAGGDPAFQDVSILYTYALRVGSSGVGSSMHVEHLVGRTVPNFDVE
jgi:hypothetical protein